MLRRHNHIGNWPQDQFLVRMGPALRATLKIITNLPRPQQHPDEGMRKVEGKAAVPDPEAGESERILQVQTRRYLVAAMSGDLSAQ
jgi:hypothetical protein